jgi:hypothetical protein
MVKVYHNGISLSSFGTHIMWTERHLCNIVFSLCIFLKERLEKFCSASVSLLCSLSIYLRSYDSRRRLPEPKHHSFLFNH